MFFKKRDKVDYFHIMEKHLKSGEYQVSSCGKDDIPTKKDIIQFEKYIGYRLPNYFRNYSMSWLGGLYVAVKEEIWPRAKAYEVGPFWTFLYGLIVYGFASDIPDWMDIKKKTEAFRIESESNFTPFMEVICDADIYCFGEDSLIYRWCHETNEFNKIDRNFVELLDYELHELDNRKEKRKVFKNA